MDAASAGRRTTPQDLGPLPVCSFDIGDEQSEHTQQDDTGEVGEEDYLDYRDVSCCCWRQPDGRCR